MRIKKAVTAILVIALAFIMLVPLEAFAEVPDFSAMTDEELHELIDGARNELKKRELNAEGGMILFEQDGVTVYLTGDYRIYGDDSKYIEFSATVVNDSDYDLNIQVDSVVLNGWDVYGGGIGGITAHHKKKGDFDLCISDADISSFEEIEEIEFNLYLYDSSAWKRISTIDPIILNFN